MNKHTVKYLVFSVIIGFAGGYLLLHPASVLIFFIFEKHSFDLFRIIRESFSMVHLAMGSYFAVIGAVLSSIVALYLANLKYMYARLLELNTSLNSQNTHLRQKLLSAKLDNKVVLQKIWPTLNKIENGVNMISNNSAGRLNLRQSALLSITKDNIDHLYEIIESLVLAGLKSVSEKESIKK